ncbi:hypothetical protein LSM04_005159 [Trypanosoma melophagium]|uniref:uncharacterized protein n=1 Tax=Trypanosoma melophagium TaxID=715481 RepID=UPI00351A3445|nr:hypothetical protein LSM04_005159 [Trypanosoma melophagium]
MHHHVTQVCNTQSLLYDQHFRRIYCTLSEFCKPEEIILRAQHTSADLCRAWKGIQSASAGATAEILSRLVSTERKEDTSDENSILMLLLSMIKNDFNYTSETLSLT